LLLLAVDFVNYNLAIKFLAYIGSLIFQIVFVKIVTYYYSNKTTQIPGNDRL